ncbi:MAG TPA: LacI family DNA-binding transcriptional regulator [Streptosporangiaceae bacterium]
MNVTGHTSGRPAAGDAVESAATATASPTASEPGAARQPRPVSIRDVAAAASVSYQTVSRVINNHPSVKESTRAAVLAAISDLGFRPNRAARSLAGGRVHAVTVLTSDTTRYGYAASLQGIEEAARAAGFAMGIQVLEGGQIGDAVQRATEPGTALIVMAYDRAGTTALAAVPPGVPVAAAVETPSGRQAEGKPWVWLDDRQAAQQATQYLLGLGHRTVHYVPIPASTGTSPRLAGWRAGLRQAGAPVPEPPAGGWTAEAGYRAGRDLAADPAVTAVLCGNDDVAVGVLRAMTEAGRPVPGSVSVVGFDDTPVSAYLTPGLTTVRLDWVALGRACFALLHSLVDPQATPAGAPPQPELVVRESAGPPAGPPPEASWA